MKRILIGFFFVSMFLFTSLPAQPAGKRPCETPKGYNHAKFAPDADILREFCGFTVSFDSKDDDDGDRKGDLLRVPHWVAQEVRRWEPQESDRVNDSAWCLNTLKDRPDWFTDSTLFASGVAPNDDSYKNSGFDRGHMAMKLLVERLGQDAAHNTHTVLNAIPQRAKFNRCIWKNLEYLTGAWAQKYGVIWVIQGPVFYPEESPVAWIGDEGERKIAVPDGAFKIVVRDKTEEERKKAADWDKQAPEVLAFLYPQLGPGYFLPCSDKRDYQHVRFLTTVDEIEELTGLNFKLPEKSERMCAAVLWDPQVVNTEKRKLFLSGCRN